MLCKNGFCRCLSPTCLGSFVSVFRDLNSCGWWGELVSVCHTTDLCEAQSRSLGFYSPERRSPEPTSAGHTQSTRLAWPAELRNLGAGRGECVGQLSMWDVVWDSSARPASRRVRMWLSRVNKYVQPLAPGCRVAGCRLLSGSLLLFTRF